MGTIGLGIAETARNGAIAAARWLWFLAALPAAALAEPCSEDRLAHFTGNWTARGALQLTPESEREAIRCRIGFAASGAGRIETSGRCATSAETRDVTGWLACDGRAYAGPLFVIEGETPRFLRDMSDAEQISLLLEIEDPDTGSMERYRLNVTTDTPNTMQMRFTRGAWTALSLRYSRQRP